MAIVHPGDGAARNAATPENHRFAAVFRALADLGVHAELALWHDDFRDEVRRQHDAVDAAPVWVNPVQDGRGLTVLDTVLRDASGARESTSSATIACSPPVHATASNWLPHPGPQQRRGPATTNPAPRRRYLARVHR